MILTNVIHNKAAESLEELRDASIPVATLSPPFELAYPAQKFKKFNLEGYGATCDDRLPEPEYQDQQVTMLDALGRVLALGGSVFYNHKDRRKDGRTISPIEWLSRVTGLSLYQVIVIDRGSSHNVDPIRLPPTTEYIFWLGKPGQRPRFNKACRKFGLVWRINPHAETSRIKHPAPFALAIPLRCILMTAPRPGDVVFDPYMGSGTTAVAATLLGLPYVGYEVNPAYIQLAEERIRHTRERWGIEDRECRHPTTRQLSATEVQECRQG